MSTYRVRQANERNQKIAAMHADRHTLREIGAVFGLSQTGVNKVLQKLGIRGHSKGVRPTPVGEKVFAYAEDRKALLKSMTKDEVHAMRRVFRRIDFPARNKTYLAHIRALTPEQRELYREAIDNDRLKHVEAMAIALDNPDYGDDEFDKEILRAVPLPAIVRFGKDQKMRWTKDLDRYVLARIDLGFTYKQIAKKLGASEYSVKSHMEKMGLCDTRRARRLHAERLRGRERPRSVKAKMRVKTREGMKDPERRRKALEALSTPEAIEKRRLATIAHFDKRRGFSFPDDKTRIEMQKLNKHKHVKMHEMKDIYGIK